MKLSFIGFLMFLPVIVNDKVKDKTADTPQEPQTSQNATQEAGQGDTTTATKKAPQSPSTAQDDTISQEMLEYLTKDELIEYVQTREKQAQNELQKYKLQVEQERLQLAMQYDTLQKQLLEHDKQIQDFYARLELYKRQLPKNYDMVKSDPALQVRAVVKAGNKCSAYNTHGDLMSLSFEECSHYLQAVGRVHKGNGQTTHVKADPVSKVMTDNPNFGKQPLPTLEQQTAQQEQATLAQ